MMPLVETGLQYHRSAHYDDTLSVRVTVKEPPMSRMRFDYEVLDQDGNLLTTGFTVLAFMRASDHHPCRPPRRLRDIFASDGAAKEA